MAMKPRVLYLMQYLEQNSDEQHPVTTAQIRKELAAKGCPVSIITLRADIQSLLEAGYYEWVHRGKECEKAEEGKKKQLKLFNINGRTNLGSLMVSCEACGMIRSMQDAFIPETFSAVYKCRGRQPWLEKDAYNQCSETAVVRMRASTGVYMPVNISALNIPPWSSKVGKLLLSHMDAMEGKNEEALKTYIQRKLCPYLPGVPLQQILGQYHALISDYNQTHPTSLKELYEEEYRALREETDDADADFSSRELQVPSKYRNCIDKVVAIDRLTEIVSMIGFTRLQGWDGNFDSPLLAPIFSWNQKTWLPAVEMHGEGIFIQLNENKVSVWERKNRKIYEPMMKSVMENHFHCENASARYVLIHTLAHLMIRALAKLCGYQTSSMKERIYSTYDQGEPMAGILIYTASSDAEGSLGGLVAQAEPEHIEAIMDTLLEEAQWCSGGPLCMTSTGVLAQGLFGLNYAACHQCTLLPETSCCNRNLLLDRAALIGREEEETTGFFEQ